MLFLAILCDILLWECESWALPQFILDLLEVFLHKNIRRILKITVIQVMEKRIKNTTIRTIF